MDLIMAIRTEWDRVRYVVRPAQVTGHYVMHLNTVKTVADSAHPSSSCEQLIYVTLSEGHA